MTITWDTKIREYEYGLDRVCLYSGTVSVPWNGVIGIKEDADSGSPTPLYFDGLRYNTALERGYYSASIAAFTYPTYLETLLNDKKQFGISYRTMFGSGGYKLHLVYNLIATFDAHDDISLADSPEASIFEFKLFGNASPVSGRSPTNHIFVDSRKAVPERLTRLEDILYGVSGPPQLPNYETVRQVLNEGH